MGYWPDHPVGGGNGIGQVGHSYIFTGESTASSAFTDLTTPGPSVTLDVPDSGTVKVTVSATMTNATGDGCLMGVALSGANTVGVDTGVALRNDLETHTLGASRTHVLEGLTPGTTTFTAKYRRRTSGSAEFSGRDLTVETLP